jgi:cytosine/adenosine deaminase-related metal-dependent hydrolase
MDLLIKGGTLVSGERADVLVDRGTIVAVGPEPTADAREVLDADGLVVAAGFVDSHRHVWQAPLRGTGADMTLPDYLTAVLGRALDAYGPAEAHLATLLGAAEALDAGITTVFDWSNTTRTPEHTDAVLDAYAAAGIRAVVGHTNPDDERDVRRLADLRGRVTGALAVLGTEYGPWDAAIRHITLGRRLGLVVSMHTGGGPGARLPELVEAGLLGPHLHLVHLNAITAPAARLLADHGAGVTVTPVVEATMGHGASAYTRLTAAGARPGLGTDVVVNAPADLFEPMRDTLRTHRTATGSMHPAARMLPAATIDSARAIGLGDTVGAVEPGRRADLVLLDGLAHLAGPEARAGAEAVAGAVVTALGPSDVRAVVVDGRIAKRDGRLVGLDLAALRREATRLADRGRAGSGPARQAG